MRLATYGTLSPGGPNHHKLAALGGEWRTGTVRGRLVEKGWGAGLGYPALVLDDSGPLIEVSVFESKDLPEHWSRLDAFEGRGYKRMTVSVETTDGRLDSWIYVAAGEGELP